MHITLIKPAMAMPLDSFTTQSGVPPIGVAYIAGYLKSKNHQVKVIDSIGEDLSNVFKLNNIELVVNGLSFDQIISRIPKTTQLIGLSIMFSNEWPVCRILIEKIKKVFPNVPVVCGGEAATADSHYIMKTTPELDYLIEGEGEEKIWRLIQQLESERKFEKVPGLIWRDSNKIIRHNGNNTRIREVDQIPWPDWSDIPVENYLEAGLGQSTYNRRVMPIVASRGCPYQCTFCTNLKMYGTNWYARSPSDVLDEVEFYIKKYNIEHFDFCDLTVIVNKDWVIDFCKELYSRKLSVTWGLPSGTRSEVLDKDVLDWLRKSGLERMNYAPESGSAKTLKMIKKGVDLDKMNRSMKQALNSDLKVKATLIFGFPDQDWKQVRANFTYMFKLAFIGIHDVACFPFVPYPGSELHERLHKENKIDKNSKDYEIWLTNNIFNKVGGMKSYSQDITHKQLQWLVIGGMSYFYTLQFIMRPWRLFTTLYRLITKNPITMLENLTYQMVLSYFVSKKQFAKNITISDEEYDEEYKDKHKIGEQQNKVI
tara:strand:- start:18409 stop:20025 length:1617 start_codon:yes stop_codon:yes gene_type:complete